MSHRDLLLAKVETHLQLADSRLELMRQHQRHLQVRIDAGLIRAEQGNRLAADIARMEIEQRRLVLDQDEIRLSSRPPQHDLSAPVLDGRDFVTERLKLELKFVQENETQLQNEMERLEKLVALGLISPREMDQVNGNRDRVHAVVEELCRKIELRTMFLNDELTAEQVEIQAMMYDTEKRVETAGAIVDQIRNRLLDMEEKHQLGLITDTELAQARYDLEAAVAEQKLAELELQTLRLEMMEGRR
jgi:hypothetical protein